MSINDHCFFSFLTRHTKNFVYIERFLQVEKSTLWLFQYMTFSFFVLISCNVNVLFLSRKVLAEEHFLHHPLKALDPLQVFRVIRVIWNCPFFYSKMWWDLKNWSFNFQFLNTLKHEVSFIFVTMLYCKHFLRLDFGDKLK